MYKYAVDGVGVSRPTLADVARAAHVHPATASKALRGTGRVHPDTIVRVRAAAAELGYYGNVPARMLQHGTRSQRLVGVAYDPDSMTGITGNAQAFWFFLLQGLTAGLSEQRIGAVQIPLRALGSSRVPIELLLVLSISSAPPCLPERYARLPLVVNQAYERDLRAAGVIFHDQKAMAAAACDHLHARGAHRIAVLPLSDHDFVSTSTIAGFRDWCSSRDLDPIVLSPANTPEAATEVVRAAAARGVDGIYAISGEMAAVLDGIRAAGLSCPQDMLVVGVGQGIMEPVLNPTLTSIFLDGEGSGRAIAALIGRLLANPAPERVSLPWRLIERGSTARLPAASR